MRNLSVEDLRPDRMRELRSCYVWAIVKLVPSRQISISCGRRARACFLYLTFRGEEEV